MHAGVRPARGPVTEAEVARWAAAIRADPHPYRLPAYGLAQLRTEHDVDRAARYFAAWAADTADPAVCASALCRRCGLLMPDPQPGWQLHTWCAPPPPG